MDQDARYANQQGHRQQWEEALEHREHPRQKMKLAIIWGKHSSPWKNQLIAKEHRAVFGVKLGVRQDIGFAHQEKDGKEEKENDEPDGGVIFSWHQLAIDS